MKIDAQDQLFRVCERYLIPSLARLTVQYYGGFRGKVVTTTRIAHDRNGRAYFRVVPNALMCGYASDDEQTIARFDEIPILGRLGTLGGQSLVSKGIGVRVE